ncbi:hypothetical protein C8F04DRAFT_1213017 [Mycena alexandri]|uniref:SMP-30/Gluconolactonase/LRE-like region domain-containing protein n=1 Tax=Mycena alexandri TaxID=1745969 RepID=A0AAD6SCS7_9AGAR|nr:hypothetical protein C8F04DRAFT_1213017 [Mycena alexandri]
MGTAIFVLLSTILASAHTVATGSLTAELIVQSTASFKSRVVYASPIFLENIVARDSSQLLLTSVAAPTLFTLDPTITSSTLDAVHIFSNATGLTGITEYRPSAFAVVASVLNLTTRRAAPGSVVIWGVDFNVKDPVIRVLAALPEVSLVNGIAVLPQELDIILAADSVAGAVWQINTRTGTSRLVIQDPSMLANAPEPAHGINGLHVQGEYLYFTNTQQGTFSRVALAVYGGNVTAVGAIQSLARIQPAGEQQIPDDFALDKQGRAWVAVHPGALALLTPPENRSGTWSQVTAVGNAEGTDGGLNQTTSAAFGRGDSVQEHILYVTTGAGQLMAVNTR